MTDRDYGYRALLQSLARVGEVSTYVGVLGDSPAARDVDGDLTVAEYGAVNEFGSEDGRIPERSFLRSTVNAREGEYLKDLANVAKVITKGEDPSVAIGLLGLKVVGHVQDTMRDLQDPPNAPSTLAAKYPGTNPLIDSSTLINSIADRTVIK